MAKLDHEGFAAAVHATLVAKGLSYRAAAARWPQLNIGMLSRAVNGHALAVENYLLICRLLRISPWRFWSCETRRRVTLKSILNQAVTAVDKRETP